MFAGAGAILSVGLMRKVALQQIKDMWQWGVRVSGGELVHICIGGRSAWQVQVSRCAGCQLKGRSQMAKLPCGH